MTADFTPKNAEKYSCQTCDFICFKTSDWDRHQTTRKHKNTYKILPNTATDYADTLDFSCLCGKKYKHRQSLFNHKKKCVLTELKIDEEENKVINNSKNDNQNDKELIIMLIKENSEFKNMMIEQQTIMMEVIKNGTHNINTISNNNSHNKAFNLNFFLNETCKNAMNITEFADSIKLQLSDFENVGDVGFIIGISNIIIKNLKALDITQRPVLKKREIIYIKDEDKWEKEDDKKQKFHKFLKKIINKNQRLLLKFQEVYPDYNKYSSPNSTRYDLIVIEALGGRGDNITEKEDKILSNISKTICVDK